MIRHVGRKRFQKEQAARKPEGGLPHTQGGRSLRRGGRVERVASGASGSQGQKVAAGFWQLGADR